MKKKCLHDHRNAIQVGPVDYMCPLCKELIDPGEWFLMNYFDFVDVTPKLIKKVSTRKNFKKTVTINLDP